MTIPEDLLNTLMKYLLVGYSVFSLHIPHTAAASRDRLRFHSLYEYPDTDDLPHHLLPADSWISPVSAAGRFGLHQLLGDLHQTRPHRPGQRRLLPHALRHPFAAGAAAGQRQFALHIQAAARHSLRLRSDPVDRLHVLAPQHPPDRPRALDAARQLSGLFHRSLLLPVSASTHFNDVHVRRGHGSRRAVPGHRQRLGDARPRFSPRCHLRALHRRLLLGLHHAAQAVPYR